MRAVTAEQMTEIDRIAQSEYGIQQIVLMENAGRFASEVILGEIKNIENKSIAVFCGKGNNGGDGFVIARYLSNKSPKRLTVYVVDILNIGQQAAGDNFKILHNLGVEIKPAKDFLEQDNEGKDFTVGVDSIFGTGFKGEMRDDYRVLTDKINACDMKVFAVDVPSGLNATTGVASKGCILAQKTITFGLAKKGFFCEDGPDVCGEIVVDDIGFPKKLLEKYLGE